MTSGIQRMLLNTPDRERLKKVLVNIVQNELTKNQGDIFLQHHLDNKSMAEIARERGLNRSSVCRTVKRAEDKIMRYLQYLA